MKKKASYLEIKPSIIFVDEHNDGVNKDPAVVINICDNFFKSHLTYGIAVWRGTSCTNLEIILVPQKRAIRCLAGLQ